MRRVDIYRAAAPPRDPPEDDRAARPADAGQPAAAAERPLTVPELELASYALARQIDSRPLERQSAALLRRATHTKQEVLGLMPYGRSNVQTDLDATGGAGLARTLAQRQVGGSHSTVGMPPRQVNLLAATLAARVGSGNCGEFANVAAHVHAGRLQDGECIEIQTAQGIDHSWALVRGAPTDAAAPASAVLDPWCEGPVIEPVDGAFTSGARGTVEVLHAIESAEGREVNDAFNDAAARGRGGAADRLDRVVAKRPRLDVPSTATVYAPTPVVSQAFASRVEQAINAAGARQALRADAVDAVLVARPLLPGAMAAALADTVIDMAASLRAPRERVLSAAAAEATPPASVGPGLARAGSGSSSIGIDSDAESEPNRPLAQRRRLAGPDGTP